MKRILIVDDDIELCDELGDMFSAEGFAVSSTAESSRIDAHISDGDFDIMILDYKMSGMTGSDVLRKMKTAGLNKEIYLVSGRPFVEKILKDENLLGMIRRVIHKPVNFGEFLKEIGNARENSYC